MKKALVTLLVTAFLGIVSLQAQTTLSGDHVITGDLNVGDSTTKGGVVVTGETGSTAVPGVKVTGDGGVIFEGTIGSGPIPSSASNSKFIWYSKKAALRTGYSNWGGGFDWTDESIGYYSTAFGQNNIASGENSFAAAYGAASGWCSAAFCGGSATATNAFGGGGHARGFQSSAFSGAYAFSSGEYSTAMSGAATFGYASVAGGLASAVGAYSFAMSGGISNGIHSTALGGGIAHGAYSTSLGQDSAAMAAYSTVVGRHNTLEGNTSTWVETDPLFVVGNGTGNTADPAEVQNRNALTVYKNGDVRIPKAQGDIPMGEFSN